jgi:hypothetical protein
MRDSLRFNESYKTRGRSANSHEKHERVRPCGLKVGTSCMLADNRDSEKRDEGRPQKS